MLLREITVVAHQPNDQIDYSWFPALQPFRTAKVETHILWFAEREDRYLFSLKDGDEIVSSIVALKISDWTDGRDTIQIKRTWTNDKYKNQGFMTAMYNTLYNQGFRVISDMQLSPYSVAIWKRLGTRAKAFDVNTRQVVPITPEMYNEPDGHEHIVFMLEKRLDQYTLWTDNSCVREPHMFLGEDCP